MVPITKQADDPGREGNLPTEKQVRDEVSSEILRIHTESYGAGASDAQAFVGDGWVIVILDELRLLPNEEFLIERGSHEAVAQVREQYQRAIQANLRAAVERATGRTVTGFASANSVENPRFAAEIFKLR